MTAPVRPLAYAARRQARFLAELKQLVRFPSVSSQPKHAVDVRRCAAWLAGHLRRIGLDRVQVVPTGGHPIVWAECRHAPGRPTILVYGHYDVVPADSPDRWQTPPFEPTVHAGNLYGRGACDDKGQLFAHIKALESYVRSGTHPPVNVKCLFEGEEEIGSPHLAAFIEQNKSALQADAAVVSDTRMLGPDRPAISYSQRGVLSLQWEVRGPAQDLHSGNFGGAVHNPLQALCEMIASLNDDRGRIAIPGFYGGVRDWSTRERDFMRRGGPGDRDILKDAKVARGRGEAGYTQYERTTIRPALTVNGITGGYQGPGVKAVIPARALAKLSFRLAPDQDPAEIEGLVRRHIARITPPTVKSTLRFFARAHPAVVDRRHPALRAAQLAYRKGFGAPAVFTRSGGTIPVVNTFQEILGIPTVLMGFALPDDRIHAPDEKFRLRNFFDGISTCIWFLAAAGERLQADRSATEPEWSLAHDH
jgi:acetylornithine deacetylase/succinyl-diaminopimelate desuccinylase-like protein